MINTRPLSGKADAGTGNIGIRRANQHEFSNADVAMM